MSINHGSTENNEATKRVSHSNSMRLLTFLSAIGGFLFGYDTGVVSGAMLLIREEMSLSTEWHEAIVSVTVGAAWLCSLGAGFLADRVGRKAVILGSSLVFTAGSVVLGAAQGKETLLVGRIIVGVAIGVASMSVPVYISENAVPEVRGRLVTTNSLFITGGQFCAAVLCGAFSSVPEGWRYMLGLAAIPAAVQFVGFLWMPESARWLISQRRYDEAARVLRSIRDADAPVEEELEAIKASCLRDDDVDDEAQKSSSLAKVLRTATTRRALVLGCALQAFQQLAGINTVMYYSGSIIQMAGLKDLSLIIWLACATAGVNFFCTFIGYYLVERVGRRTLTLVSLTGVVLSLITLGVAFQIMSSGSPQVSVPGSGNCGLQRSCSECVDEGCGFCYVESASGVSNGSCEPLSSRGRCSDVSGLTWAEGWCPSHYSFLAVAALAIYLLFFAPGMGTMPWTINSEIYPTWARSFCNSVATSTNYLCNLIVSMTFLTLTEVLTKQGAFYLYAGFATAGLLILLRILPETKGKTLEEMDQLFSGSLCSQFRSGDDKRIRDKKSDETTDL